MKIRIAFTDFPGPFNPGKILRLLKKNFEIEIDNHDPDYVIYSVNGHDFFKYTHAVRIFFTGENIHPDFNLCDYAFGYDWLEFGDRYCRCPNYVLYDQYRHICTVKKSNISDVDLNKKKPNFCNFIYTNGFAHPFRDEFFHLLSQSKKVDSAGSHLRNIEAQIGKAYEGDWSAPKVDFQRSYKFSFAFENSSTPGYTTEKIVHAFAADTIPVYWGNPNIDKEFNTKRFINCHDFDSPEAIVKRILTIDKDDGEFLNIMNQPFFPDDQIPEIPLEDRVVNQFKFIFDQAKNKVFRRNFYAWGKKYEKTRIAESQAFIKNGDNSCQKLLQKIFKG